MRIEDTGASGSDKKGTDAIAGASIVNTSITEISAVIREMEKIAISSPIMSAGLLLIVGDILHTINYKAIPLVDTNGMPIKDSSGNQIYRKGGIISDGTWLGIQTMIYTSVGIALTEDVITGLLSFTDIFGTGRTLTAPLSNSIQTLVISDPASKDQLNALLSTLSKKG